jgi:hypothetical protein
MLKERGGGAVRIWMVRVACAALLALLCACDRREAATSAAGDDNNGPDPCSLLSSDQVATVLPGADEGYVAARGGSLVKGIDSYQCSYSDQSTNMLLVMFHTAATSELFDDIKPKNPAWAVGEDNVQRVALGDGGWLEHRDDGLKLKASRGRLVIELELDTVDANDKSGALTALGQALFDALPNT